MLLPGASLCDDATRSKDQLKDKRSHLAATANDSSFDCNRRNASSTAAPIIKSMGLFTLFSTWDPALVAIMPRAVENRIEKTRNPEPDFVAFFQSASRMARKKNGTKNIGICYYQEHRFSSSSPKHQNVAKMENAFFLFFHMFFQCLAKIVSQHVVFSHVFSMYCENGFPKCCFFTRFFNVWRKWFPKTNGFSTFSDENAVKPMVFQRCRAKMQ